LELGTVLLLVNFTRFLVYFPFSFFSYIFSCVLLLVNFTSKFYEISRIIFLFLFSRILLKSEKSLILCSIQNVEIRATPLRAIETLVLTAGGARQSAWQYFRLALSDNGGGGDISGGGSAQRAEATGPGPSPVSLRMRRGRDQALG